MATDKQRDRIDNRITHWVNNSLALQMDIKLAGITEEIMKVALAQAKDGRMHILGEMAKAIDTSRAEKLPGVKAVITGKDTLGIKHGFVETPRYPPDQYPLAMDRVRYRGEEVAAVAAIDEYIAEEALTLIRVDYEELPAVFDPEEAMKPEAPEIHPSHPKVKEPYKNIGGKTESDGETLRKDLPNPILCVRTDSMGS